MTKQLFNQFDFSQIDQKLSAQGQNSTGFFSDLIRAIINGDFDRISEWFIQGLKSMFLPGLSDARELLLKLLLLGLLCTVLKYTADFVKKRQISDMARLTVYFVFMNIMLTTFETLFSQLDKALTDGNELIRLIVPVFCLSVSVSRGALSGAVNYEMLVLMLWGVEFLLQQVFLPVTKMYLELTLLDGIDEEHRFGGFVRLFQRFLRHGINFCIAFIVGVAGFGNLLSKGPDSLQKLVLTKTIGVIPGIGDLSASCAELLFQTGAMIRNAIGIGSVLVLVYLSFYSLIKILAIAFTMKLGAALFELMGQKEFAGNLSAAGETGFIMTRIRLCQVLVFAVIICGAVMMG